MATYDFTYPKYGKVTPISVWEKGKKYKSIRILCDVDGPTLGKANLLIWIEEHSIFKSMEFLSVEISKKSYKSKTHIKLGSYNYYFLTDDKTDVVDYFEKMCNEWKESDPNVSIPNPSYDPSKGPDVIGIRGLIGLANNTSAWKYVGVKLSAASHHRPFIVGSNGFKV